VPRQAHYLRGPRRDDSFGVLRYRKRMVCVGRPGFRNGCLAAKIMSLGVLPKVPVGAWKGVEKGFRGQPIQLKAGFGRPRLPQHPGGDQWGVVAQITKRRNRKKADRGLPSPGGVLVEGL